MVYVIHFTSARFNPSNDRENPINPIAGAAVLEWLSGALPASIRATDPAPEAGLYIDHSHPDSVFAEGESISAVDFTNQRMGATAFTVDSVPDPGVPAYMGTVILNLSDDAAGTFTVQIEGDQSSFLDHNREFQPLVFEPLTIIVQKKKFGSF